MRLTVHGPSVMSTQEHLSEIATLLARGYLRLISQKESQKGLDVSAETSAQCDTVVNRNRSIRNKEVVA